MVKNIGSLVVRFDEDSANAARKSFEDLFFMARSDLFGISECLSGLFCGEFVSPDDVGDLIWGKPVNLSAGGAGELHGIKVDTCDAYLVLFSALARHSNSHRVSISHGWPHLVRADVAE